MAHHKIKHDRRSLNPDNIPIITHFNIATKK